MTNVSFTEENDWKFTFDDFSGARGSSCFNVKLRVMLHHEDRFPTPVLVYKFLLLVLSSIGN